MSTSPPDWISNLPSHYGFKTTNGYLTQSKGSILNPENVILKQPYHIAVLGAGKSIGKEIAKSYAKAGASGIAVSSRTLTDLQQLEREIHEINTSIKVIYQVADCTKETDLTSFASKVREGFGRLDVAVVSAGVAPRFQVDPDTKENAWPQGLLGDTTEEFMRVFNINFYGSYLSARAFLPLLRETKQGVQALLFLSSISALFESDTLTPFSYNVSKMGINQLAEFIHRAHHGEGIVTHAFHPGGIATPLTVDYPKIWKSILTDDVSLPGGFAVWLTKERREWLSGRFLIANCDVTELESKREQIYSENALRIRLVTDFAT